MGMHSCMYHWPACDFELIIFQYIVAEPDFSSYVGMWCNNLILARKLHIEIISNSWGHIFIKSTSV